MHKIYKKNNYIIIEGLDYIAEYPTSSIFVDKNENEDNYYIYFSNLDKCVAIVKLPEILNEVDIPYNEAQWESFYTTNTGFFFLNIGNTGNSGTIPDDQFVQYYSNLPDPTLTIYELWIVKESQGTSWLPGSLGGTYYPEGVYVSDGSKWIYHKDSYQATQSEVNDGIVTDKWLNPSTFTNASKWLTKVDRNNAIVAGTKTKITYDEKGLVVSATDATKADIGLGNVDNTSDADKPVSTVQATALGLKVPYTGATSDVNLGEFGVQLGNIEFDLTPISAPTGPGTLSWNDVDGTLNLGLKGGNVTLQIGQEFLERVVNKTGANLLESEFRAVRIRDVAEGGAQGQRLAVVLAQADSSIHSHATIGVVTENISNNQEGFITLAGQVNNINTTGSNSVGGSETWVDGDRLYLSPTNPGYLTNIPPTAPNHTITVGWVVYSHASQGKLFIGVTIGSELNELHNVKITNPINDDLLLYNSTTGIWENRTLPGGNTFNLSGTTVLNFVNEDSSTINTIPNASITSLDFKSVVFINQETAETSLDDFTLNGVTFNIENIIDNVSFDIRGTSLNGASGNYTIKYLIN